MKQVWSTAVTFEFANAAPLCHRGELAANHPRTVAARAISAAKKVFKGTSPRSIVILLEKKDD
jgi:hypothetical protein